MVDLLSRIYKQPPNPLLSFFTTYADEAETRSSERIGRWLRGGEIRYVTVLYEFPDLLHPRAHMMRWWCYPIQDYLAGLEGIADGNDTIIDNLGQVIGNRGETELEAGSGVTEQKKIQSYSSPHLLLLSLPADCKYRQVFIKQGAWLRTLDPFIKKITYLIIYFLSTATVLKYYPTPIMINHFCPNTLTSSPPPY